MENGRCQVLLRATLPQQKAILAAAARLRQTTLIHKSLTDRQGLVHHDQRLLQLAQTDDTDLFTTGKWFGVSTANRPAPVPGSVADIVQQSRVFGASPLNNLALITGDGFHLSVNRRADIQHERWLWMNPQMNAPVVKNPWWPESISSQRQLTVFVRAAQLAPESRGVNEFAGDDVIRVSVFPVRREDRFRPDFAKNVGELLPCFKRVLKLPIW